MTGDWIGGDKVGGDKVGGDKTGGDKVVGDKGRGDTITNGIKATVADASPPEKSKRGAAAVLVAGVLGAIGILVVFLLLARDDKLSYALAVPLGCALAMASLAIANMVASHMRS